MQRLADFLTRGRGILAIFAVAVTLAAYWGNQRLGQDSGSAERTGPPTESERVLKQIDTQFPTSDVACYLLVDQPPGETSADFDLFTPASVEALRALVDRLEAVEDVADVIWLERVVALDDDGSLEPLLPPAGADPESFDRARHRAQQHPLVAGRLLTEDLSAMLLVVQIDPSNPRRSNNHRADDIRKVARRATDEGPFRVRLTGTVPLDVEAKRIARRENDRYMKIGPILAFVLAAWLFRGAAAVVIVSLAPLVGVYWTTGAMGLVGEKINPLNAATLPVLTLMIGFTDAIHLMIFIRRERHEGTRPHRRLAHRHRPRRPRLPCSRLSLPPSAFSP